MRVVVLKGNCPTNRGSCPLGVIVLSGRCPMWIVVLVVNWQRGSYPMGVIVLQGSCPRTYFTPFCKRVMKET